MSDRVDTKVQMTLDFGQKDYGPKCCNECQMVYTAGNAFDLKAHAQYHSKYLNQVIKISRWQNQSVLEDFFDGSRIIEIAHDDRVGMAIFKRISELMNRDLGHDNLANVRPTSALNREILPHVRIFVYVEGIKKSAVGCCLAEELTADSVRRHGYRVHRLIGGKQALLSWQVQAGEKIENKIINDFPLLPQKGFDSFPLCGIRRLWVAAKHRRRKVASTLLNCVTQNLMYLTHFDPSRVAFAEPTSDGAEFASKYTGVDDFLVY